MEHLYWQKDIDTGDTVDTSTIYFLEVWHAESSISDYRPVFSITASQGDLSISTATILLNFFPRPGCRKSDRWTWTSEMS